MRVFGQHAVAAAVLLGETPNLAEGRGRLRGLHTRGTQKSAAAAHQKKMKKTLMTIGETNPAEEAANAKMDKETDAKALADANDKAVKAGGPRPVDPKDSGSLSAAQMKAKKNAEKNLAKEGAPFGDWKALESSFKKNGETPSDDEVKAAMKAAGASPDDAVAAAKRTAEKDLEAAGAPEAEPANTGGCY